jgi:hypothetical protein
MKIFQIHSFILAQKHGWMDHWKMKSSEKSRRPSAHVLPDVNNVASELLKLSTTFLSSGLELNCCYIHTGRNR